MNVLDEIWGGALNARMEDIGRRRDLAWDRYWNAWADYKRHKEAGNGAGMVAATFDTTNAYNEWWLLDDEHGALDRDSPPLQEGDYDRVS